ncbi:MAG TPA: hypothetical protein VH479_19455 [Acidimicrobiales bacterium]
MLAAVVAAASACGPTTSPASDDAQASCRPSATGTTLVASATADDASVSLRYPVPVCELPLPASQVDAVWNEHAAPAWRVSGDDDLESPDGRVSISTAQGPAGGTSMVTVNVKSELDGGVAWRTDAALLGDLVQALAAGVADDDVFGRLVRASFDDAAAATSPYHELSEDDGRTVLVAANADQVVVAVTGPRPATP